MGDTENGAALQGQPGQVGGASQAGATSTEGATSQPVTIESVQSLIDNSLKQIRKDFMQWGQRKIDSDMSAVQGRLRSEFQNIDNYVKMLKEAGQEVSPQIIEQMKQKRLMQEFTGEPTQEEGSREDQAQGLSQGRSQGKDQQTNPVISTALALMQEEGVFIEDNDPEVKLIDLKTTSPKTLLQSVLAAIEAKKTRLSGASNGQNQNNQEGDAARAAARNPGKGASAGKPVAGSSPDGLTSMDYFKRAYNKPK